MKHGILLVNLGTPDAPTPSAVRRYLKEFLGDPRVIDLPAIPRNILLYGLILPFRPFKTAKAYQEIWDEKGSPLLYLSQSLEKHLQHAMGEQYIVKMAMRYGSHNIESTLNEMLPEVSKITVVPMYPQYASSTTGSVIEEVYRVIGKAWNIPKVDVIDDYYDKPWYLEALAERTRPFIESFKPDHVLMSFHGLPVRQLEKTGGKACDQTQPCPMVSEQNHYCYRAQCYQSARGLAQKLNLAQNYSVGFQSRLGRIPWIQPYVDNMLEPLYEQGVKRLSVVCPSFVTDCLETLEEIGIRLKEDWLALGGDAFQLIPALNDSPIWVQSLKRGIMLAHIKRGSTIPSLESL